MKATVIGAGIGGLSVALRLRKLGYEVEVYEANDYVGGKLAEIELKGYRFDMGPSLFTLPDLIDELFTLHNRNPRNYFKYRALDDVCHYFWQDGKRVTSFSDKKKFEKEVDVKLGVHRSLLRDYLKRIKLMYDLLSPVFMKRSLSGWRTLFSKESWKVVKKLGKLGLLTSMNKFNYRMLHEKHIVQLFNRMATYNGSSPYQTRGTFALIGSLEHGNNAFFPEGGMYQIVSGLKSLAEEVGITFHLNQKVTAIQIEAGKVTGIVANEQNVRSDVVVSNIDVEQTYKLMKGVVPPKSIRNAEKSSSALVFYLGMKECNKELGLHNIFFSEDYKLEFEYLFKRKELYHDPTIYLHISSKKEEGDAPVGCENWFLMINVPSGVKINSDEREKIKMTLLRKIEGELGKNLLGMIECEQFLDPERIEQRTGAIGGALYGASSNKRMSAFLRQQNKSKQVEGLYFCGGTVHPGGGIPLAVLSGKITAELIQESLSI